VLDGNDETIRLIGSSRRSLFECARGEREADGAAETARYGIAIENP